MPKTGIVDCFHVVLNTTPLPISGGVKVAERQKNALEKWPDESNNKAAKGGQDKQRSPALNVPADQDTVC